jgi:hypothetical protein
METPVRTLIQRHRPWDELQNLALAIIDQTYAAALQIAGNPRDAATTGVVKLSRPLDPADPYSPVLTVHAAATHCCVAFTNARGDADAFAKLTSSKGKTHRLDQATITISPGTLHLVRTGGGGGVRRKNRVDVGISGRRRELAIVDAIVSRLDASMRVQRELLGKASAAGLGSSPKMAEINQVFKTLQEMRREMDLQAVMRGRIHKRRAVVQETAANTTARGEDDQTTEGTTTKRLRTMRVVDPRSRSRVEVLQQTCRSAT